MNLFCYIVMSAQRRRVIYVYADVWALIMRYTPAVSRVSRPMRAIYTANMYQYDDFWRATLQYVITHTDDDFEISKSIERHNNAVVTINNRIIAKYDQKYKICCVTQRYDGRIAINVVMYCKKYTGARTTAIGIVYERGGCKIYREHDKVPLLNVLFSIIVNWIRTNSAAFLEYATVGEYTNSPNRYNTFVAGPPFLQHVPRQLMELVKTHKSWI